ncbi:MAG TPA: hydrogenase maturation protease [Candidatus Saccharicenans sp.]|nr:hydrogenase maturation protease [Candidatus Saccharicenans sp.]HQM73723.1 hydrogenase maturation protease [Candidatus Saccharicenans sp.]
MEALESLQQVLAGRTCLVGIGNKLRGDDGFGLYFIESIKTKTLFPSDNLLAVEDVPENYAFPLAQKDVENVIFIDAVLFDAPVGTVIFGPLAELEKVSQIVSTHKLSLRLTAQLLEKTGKKVFLLGVVPETTGFGQELTPHIKKIADELITIFEKILDKAAPLENTGEQATIQVEREKGQ